MKLEIYTPDGLAYEGEISGVRMPGILGSFEVLENHAALISSLEEGEVKITKKDGKVETLTIDTGTVGVLNNQVTLLADTIKK